MKRGHFSGLPTLTLEDAVVSAAGGEIRPRDKEMLCAPDVGVAMLYRSLLKLPQQADRGERPEAASMSVAKIRGFGVTAEANSNWKDYLPKPPR